jgi:uncharacterized protein (TIGR02145 family)
MKFGFLIFGLIVLFVACSEKNSFTDPRDGKVYKTVKIGDQIWMAENLAYKTKNGHWVFAYDSTIRPQYGILYDWEAAKTACPKGWHLPSDSEWMTLINNLGGKDIAGLKMLTLENWSEQRQSTLNSSGFSAFPAGCMTTFDKYIQQTDVAAYYWSSSQDKDGFVFYININFPNGQMDNKYASQKAFGYSVRCIKDKLCKDD